MFFSGFLVFLKGLVGSVSGFYVFLTIFLWFSSVWCRVMPMFCGRLQPFWT